MNATINDARSEADAPGTEPGNQHNLVGELAAGSAPQPSGRPGDLKTTGGRPASSPGAFERGRREVGAPLGVGGGCRHRRIALEARRRARQTGGRDEGSGSADGRRHASCDRAFGKRDYLAGQCHGVQRGFDLCPDKRLSEILEYRHRCPGERRSSNGRDRSAGRGRPATPIPSDVGAGEVQPGNCQPEF